MEKTLTAVFDGQVLQPDTPADLEPNARYIITVRKADLPPPSPDAWDVLDEHAGAITAPEDRAAEHDHYLYGTPKRARSRNVSAERFFLDTAFVRAMLNRRDQYHSRARALLPRFRAATEVWITEAILPDHARPRSDAVTADTHFRQAGYRPLLAETD